VFIPALVALLCRAEQLKGSALTEEEVLRIRDNGHCVAMKVADAVALDKNRGYNDIEPELAWEGWQEVRLQFDPAWSEMPLEEQ
jgi:hypothetical protein